MIQEKEKGKKLVQKERKDVWNAFMLRGATFGPMDIPLSPCTAKSPPLAVVSWPEAVSIHNRKIKKGKRFYIHKAYVHFYIDDYKFCGAVKGIWQNPKNALNILKHFAGVITPDFSTYQDFPFPEKLIATYRMRAFGYWLGKEGISVINNVRWGTAETWAYSFLGIQQNSIVAIGTVGGSPRSHSDRERFNKGFLKMIEVLQPKCIVVVGSANYECFKEAQRRGIEICQFDSPTAAGFKARGKNV